MAFSDIFSFYVCMPFVRMWNGLQRNMHRQDRNVAHGAHDAGVTSRIPPAWAPEVERSYSFLQYVQDIEIWATATDIEAHRVAATVALRLQGSAKIVVREMDPQVLANGAMIPNPQAALPGQAPMLQITGLQFLLRQLRRRSLLWIRRYR